MRLDSRLSRLETRLLPLKERVWQVFLTVPRPLYSNSKPCPEHDGCLVGVNGPLEMHCFCPPDTEGSK
jgi:hypothetical protein